MYFVRRRDCESPRSFVTLQKHLAGGDEGAAIGGYRGVRWVTLPQVSDAALPRATAATERSSSHGYSVSRGEVEALFLDRCEAAMGVFLERNEAGELGSHAADALRAGVEALSYEHYDELVDLCILRRRVREQAERRRLAQRSEDSRAWASAVSAGGLADMPSVRKARRVLLARGGAGTADEWLDAEWSAAGDATRDNGGEGGRSDGGSTKCGFCPDSPTGLRLSLRRLRHTVSL